MSKPPEEGELLEEKKANLTDPESQTLNTRTGWVRGYNGQAAVDCDSHVIVAQEITTDTNDVQQLEPILEGCTAVAGNHQRSSSLTWILDRSKRSGGG